MSDKRELLKAIIAGNMTQANDLIKRLKIVSKRNKTITVWMKNGKIRFQNREFSETEFDNYLNPLRKEFKLRVVIYKTHERKRQ